MSRAVAVKEDDVTGYEGWGGADRTFVFVSVSFLVPFWWE